MSNQKVGYLLLIPSLILGLVLFNINSRTALSAASHVVISEVMVGASGTGNTNLEFIELYNPTEESVSLSNWKLTRKTAAGTESELVSTMSGTIAPHGYVLIGSPEYDATAEADMIYNTDQHLAANNSVLLYGNDGTTVIDKVGMGSATDVESTAAANPAAGKSVERKATPDSTALTMMIGGLDELLGNGEDTNNNGNDFVLRDVPQPQTALSAAEPQLSTPSASATVTPTGSPSATASASATPTPTPTPSVTPTPAASPSVTPSATPTATPTATPIPTPSPTVAPTMTPSPTASPSTTPSASPTASPTPSATPHVWARINLGDRTRVCTVTYETRRILFFTIRIPNLECFTVNN